MKELLDALHTFPVAVSLGKFKICPIFVSETFNFILVTTISAHSSPLLPPPTTRICPPSAPQSRRLTARLTSPSSLSSLALSPSVVVVDSL